MSTAAIPDNSPFDFKTVHILQLEQFESVISMLYAKPLPLSESLKANLRDVVHPVPNDCSVFKYVLDEALERGVIDTMSELFILFWHLIHQGLLPYGTFRIELPD